MTTNADDPLAYYAKLVGDLEEAVKDLPPDESLQGIAQLANRLESYEELLLRVAAVAADIQSKRSKISDSLLPEAMVGAGLQSFTMESGKKVNLKSEVYAEFPKNEAKRQVVIKYLVEQGVGALVRTTIELNFGRDEAEFALAARELLDKNQINYGLTETVHPQTFKAWVKERLSLDKPPDKAVITYHEAKTVKIK